MSTALVSTGVTFPNGQTQTTKEVGWTLISTTSINSTTSPWVTTVSVTMDTSTYKRFKVVFESIVSYMKANVPMYFYLSDGTNNYATNTASSQYAGGVLPTTTTTSNYGLIALSPSSSYGVSASGYVDIIVASDRYSASIRGISSVGPFTYTDYTGATINGANSLSGAFQGLAVRTNSGWGTISRCTFSIPTYGIFRGTIKLYGAA